MMVIIGRHMCGTCYARARMKVPQAVRQPVEHDHVECTRIRYAPRERHRITDAVDVSRPLTTVERAAMRDVWRLTR